MTDSNNDTILFQPRFPSSVGGRPIRFLRVVKDDEGCFVAKVTHLSKKETVVIAECRIHEKMGNYSFETKAEDWGHRTLCLLLLEKGIGGRYREWLVAKEKGDKQMEEENRYLSEIHFACDPFDGKEAEDWFRKLKVAS
jgi:hypothetical protein